ncbi:MAG: aspartate 1-decarboxylase [Deltaproteobacteria bacterium]|jgi:aspartate 1-decarboxylase|nr:aspartate 1-decarboxylase [Deltaproteobacteria bacterium]
MEICLLKSKIHRVTINQTELGYVGSITIDEDLMTAANIVEYEKVLVVDLDNGQRLETYCIAGPKGSGLICLNGAAARLMAKGDKAIIMAFCLLHPAEAKNHRPDIVFVDAKNKIIVKKNAEKPGSTEGVLV